jgi:hypothetical protein
LKTRLRGLLISTSFSTVYSFFVKSAMISGIATMIRMIIMIFVSMVRGFSIFPLNPLPVEMFKIKNPAAKVQAG